MRPADRGTPPGSDLSPCPLHRGVRPAGPGAGEGARPAAGVPGRGRGVEIRPMMSWMLHQAWGEVAAGGGAAGIMSPLPSAPRPPGPHALVGSKGRCLRGFLHHRDPWAPPRDSLWPGSLSCWRCGPWTAGEWRTPPLPCAEARVCARVCAGVGGALSAPSVLKTPASPEPEFRRWFSSPVYTKGRWISPHTSQPRSSEDLCTPKALQCPQSPFTLSPSQKPFLIFLSGFIASLHCS